MGLSTDIMIHHIWAANSCTHQKRGCTA